MHCQSNFVSLFLLVHGLNNLYAMMDCARRQYEVPQTLSSKSKLSAHMILNWINFLSPISSIHIYAGFHRANEMIGRSGLTRQAERTNAYSSIAEEGTSSRARLNAKSKVKRSSKCWTFVYLCSAPDFVRPLQVLPQQTAPERHPRGTHKYILIAASARTWRGS